MATPAAKGRMLSQLLVGVSLAAMVFWGHHTDWRFIHSSPAVTHSAKQLCVVAGQTLTFESANAVETAGIEIAPVLTVSMTEVVTASGEIGFDPGRVIRLAARAGGNCERVTKAVGDQVNADELLTVIDAADVGKAKSEFLQALVRVRLKRQSLTYVDPGGVTTNRQRQEAEADLHDAELRWQAAGQILHNFGLPLREADFANLTTDAAAVRLRGVGTDGTGISANLLPVRSPTAGVITEVHVVAGEFVNAGTVLFIIVNPSRVWLTLNIAAEDVPRVKLGQIVRYHADGQDKSFTGRISWLAPAVDEATRTLRARVELENMHGELRASTLGRAEIIIREAANAVVVPSTAVQSLRGQAIVFVRDPGFLKADGAKAFHIRLIKIGTSDKVNTEILSGLKPGEVIATSGSTTLKGALP